MRLNRVNSEFRRLTSVLLYKPTSEINSYPAPSQILHLRPIEHRSLLLEFDAIIATYKSFGIDVTIIDSAVPLDSDLLYQYNMMYCRDLFFMTPAGAIMANMANVIRSKEPLYAARTLSGLSVPLLHTVFGEGLFEGADALWVKNNLVAVGVGNRTNNQGYKQLKDVLNIQGVECVAIPSTQVTTQHLLGSVQIVDSDLALVRNEIIDSEVIRFLEDHGFMVVKIPENMEVRNRQAMNIVTVAPRTIFMSAGCPCTKLLYEKAGLKIAAELELTQLINGAGGLACATGIVARV